MDANYQTDALWTLAGEAVVLNIGLGKGSAHTIVGVPHRLRAITRMLPTVLNPGYKAELVLIPKHVWVGEPMLIVQGVFRNDIHLWDGLWNGLIAAEQDCIAIHHERPDLSRLFGPLADKWGGFNVNFFSFMGDDHG